jgi:mono/diheme cytochrome c family protein
MGKFIVGFIVGFVVLPVLAFFYVYFGYAPVATAGPPLPLERYTAHLALNARIRKEMPKDSPVPPTEANLTAGAKLYREYCAVCHGTAGEPKTATAKGMFPAPPQLLQGKGVTDDPVGETFWKVANGIRLTGMPAYEGSLTNDELWQVSQFLAHANELPLSARQIMAQPAPAH